MEEREREKKNEYESAKDGAQVRGRQNERNVCEKETDLRHEERDSAREGQRYS